MNTIDTGALIIASGKTNSRTAMEPMLQIGSISVIQRLCMTFHLAGVSPIVVVISQEERQAIEKHLLRMPVIFIADTGPEMFDGVKAGLAYYANSGATRVLITPVCVPLFSVETVKSLLGSTAQAAIPVSAGRNGHPLLLDARLIPPILPYSGDGGLSGAMRCCGVHPVSVEVDDPGVYVQSDQFEECEKIVMTHSLNQWRPVMKLRIAKESVFFGPGIWQLLSLIESTGSVRIASEYMGISYSKAWKLLNNLEQQTGYLILTRKKGGRDGGSSRITKQGKLLMEWYETIERRCSRAINDIFHENPPPGIGNK